MKLQVQGICKTTCVLHVSVLVKISRALVKMFFRKFNFEASDTMKQKFIKKFELNITYFGSKEKSHLYDHRYSTLNKGYRVRNEKFR